MELGEYNIGKILWYLRKKYHIPASVFFDDCSYTAIAELERNETKSSMNIAIMLFARLGISMEQLEVVLEQCEFTQYAKIKEELKKRALKNIVLSIGELEEVEEIFYFPIMKSMCKLLMQRKQWDRALEICDRALSRNSYIIKIEDWKELIEDKIFLFDKIGGCNKKMFDQLKTELQCLNMIIEQYIK